MRETSISGRCKNEFHTTEIKTEIKYFFLAAVSCTYFDCRTSILKFSETTPFAFRV